MCPSSGIDDLHYRDHVNDVNELTLRHAAHLACGCICACVLQGTQVRLVVLDAAEVEEHVGVLHTTYNCMCVRCRVPKCGWSICWVGCGWWCWMGQRSCWVFQLFGELCVCV